MSVGAVTRSPLERIPNWVSSSFVRSCLELRGPTGVARILATESAKEVPLGLVIEPENILSVRFEDFYDGCHNSMNMK